MGRVVVASISVILVVGVVIGVVATVSRGSDGNGKENNGGLATGLKAVETLCGPTEYKDVCMKTLSPIAEKNSNASPKDLMKSTFEAAFNEVNKALEKSTSLGNGVTNSSYDKLSMGGCKEVMDYAGYSLRKAILKVSKTEIWSLGQLSEDLNTWLSSVLAYKSTCLDEIENPELKKAMEDALQDTNKITANALGIIEEVSKFLSKINFTIPSFEDLKKNSRRLLSADGYPTWFSAADRKLLAARSGNQQVKPNVVVAKDGSGQFKTISEAIAAYPKNHRGRFVIYVKAGIYKEYVTVPQKAINVYMYGDGPRKTIVTGDKNFAINGINTMNTATFAAIGDGFIARSMAFQNTAGAAGHQAVALRVASDMSAFYNCRIDGYQDTLYYHAQRSFYRNCVISGTIDFIFGKGTALIQNSKIIVRMGAPNQFNTVTADGRENKLMRTGLVIQNCNIVADARLHPQRLTYKSYLGRPWKQFAKTMVMESVISDVINPDGWTIWNPTDPNSDLSEIREYRNTGVGGNTNRRVKWKGLQLVTDRRVAEQYTAGPFFDGGKWIPATGGPFTLGLRR
ncbi:Pectinesterase/pectinesterase inhibitor [Thalictrum thalictroides]|uniref:Pectinesterase n=1 Tax=Thalictrum thalictroides TaxID=46969 RepID=A0A7J6VVC1_THATH|nr:Pectinesterase/pectinesterase inhibitor [Thalictrum thalictroides]